MSYGINYTLYFFNSIVLLLGIILFSYYSNTNNHNKTIIELNCGNTYFLSFLTLINAFVNLLTIKNIKYLGVITTTCLFSYNSYNIENIVRECIINNSIIWFYYLFCIIVNGINIFVYLLTFIEYIRSTQNNKVYIVDYNTGDNGETNEHIEQNRIYDVNNNLIIDTNNIYE